MDDSKKARTVAKLVTNLVTVGSVDFLIGGVLASTMPPKVGLPMVAARFIGSLVLAGFIGDKMTSYIDTTVEQTCDIIDQTQDLITKIKAEKEKNTVKEEMGA